MFILTSNSESRKSILICCNYSEECYVFLVNNLKLKIQKAEHIKQLRQLDIGSSILCDDKKNSYGRIKITRVPSLNEYSFLTIPIENI